MFLVRQLKGYITVNQSAHYSTYKKEKYYGTKI